MQIGWIGTGNMGGEMAKRLAREGFDLHVYNRTRSKAEAIAGAGNIDICESPKEVAEKSDCIFTSLTDDKAILDVLSREDGVFAGAKAGCALIDVSTIGPHASRNIEEVLRARGLRYLSAPVQGSMFIIAKGFLSVLCSGDKGVYSEFLPVLEALGKRATFYGEGHESRCVKISNNMLVTAYLTLAGEVLAVGEAIGLPWEELVERMSSCCASARMLADHNDDVVNRRWQSKAALTSTALKDLSLAVEMAHKRHLNLPVTSIARSYDQLMHHHGSYTTYSSYGTVAVLEDICDIQPSPEPADKDAAYQMLAYALAGMQAQLFAESCILSEKHGVEWGVVLKDLLECFGATKLMKEHAENLQMRSFDADALPARQVAEALHEFAAFARSHGIFTPIAETAAQRINALLAHDANADIFALVPFAEEEAGIA